MEKKLAVFDFDHTIVQDNSDVVAINLIDPKKIPPELKKLHKSDGWTLFMQEIFQLLHKYDIKEDKIKSVIVSLEEVEGMGKLIRKLKELNFDVIIISDSNTYFINAWLEANNLSQYVYKVFSNPAYFNEAGVLIISMYHLQTTCNLSTKNLCKGQIMEDFIKAQKDKGISYEKIIYCGDGMNDYCPILKLNKTDLACVRKGYKCVELVKKSKDGFDVDETGNCRIVNANLCVWSNGNDIYSLLS
ncbi:pyridoxal phosphate phosphatase PHOSPHO2-like [Diorhabda sublineata]|uniref:pyridoxal phosphate phosphatase PHOSPHO2-like n=1 Tax=Diorhabda sublineata TaxID=1163346 RepID=UPI0024E0788A|nr:pyridoxal phosphate phosphatase PHOSPHO2-like [Diorhabda sublineata]XP_056633295.1 pyridoxal phosphate phosphatase PHOSPHO2-like [Diorhabda sublineata]